LVIIPHTLFGDPRASLADPHILEFRENPEMAEASDVISGIVVTPTVVSGTPAAKPRTAITGAQRGARKAIIYTGRNTKSRNVRPFSDCGQNCDVIYRSWNVASQYHTGSIRACATINRPSLTAVKFCTNDLRSFCETKLLLCGLFK